MRYGTYRPWEYSVDPAEYPKVKTKYTRKEVERIVKNGVYAINGKGPDTYGLAKAFYGAVAISLFGSIHQAFLAKSAGGRDELGHRWVDLAPATKAYSRPDARDGLVLRGPKLRPSLTRAQNKRWKGVFSSVIRHLMNLGEEEEEARKVAAATAWRTVKEELGAVPIIDLVRNKRVPILVQSHRLESSLRPGSLNEDSGYQKANWEQVFSYRLGEVRIGTRVDYAGFLDKKRKLWPDNISPWMVKALEAGRDAFVKKLVKILRAKR